MRFIVDEDLSPDVALIGRRLGLDIVHVRDEGRSGYGDDEQLRLAGEEGRCIVTKDDPDLSALSQEFVASQFPHAGVLIVSRSLDRRDSAGIAHALVAYANDHPGDMPPYMVDYLHRAPAES